MESILVLLLFYIEEGIAITYVGLALVGAGPEIRRVVSVGVLQGMAIYLVRNSLQILGVTPFVHTLVLLVSFMVLLRLVGKLPWGFASAAGLMAFIILLVSELTTIPLLYRKLHLTYEEVMISTWRHILLGYVGDAVLFLTAIILRVTGFALFKAGKPGAV